jgi:hypothetical protein
VETANHATSVKATSAETPAVTAPKPAAATATAGCRIVAGEDQSACKQRNDRDRHFRRHDILSCCSSWPAEIPPAALETKRDVILFRACTRRCEDATPFECDLPHMPTSNVKI